MFGQDRWVKKLYVYDFQMRFVSGFVKNEIVFSEHKNGDAHHRYLGYLELKNGEKTKTST